ncbi:hypothetical protein ElyMa_000009400 [Elysia marginata]|uniref:Uncharacterized protein n=1 Tax=Elysia marginata TaxID=1093978 RepID=A0AAV4EAB1_9GAST|nr:hypothetical protein ElyMa_000009400 [Elysia marginata]
MKLGGCRYVPRTSNLCNGSEGGVRRRAFWPLACPFALVSSRSIVVFLSALPSLSLRFLHESPPPHPPCFSVLNMTRRLGRPRPGLSGLRPWQKVIMQTSRA